jgi:hypothetical protein
MHQASGQVGGPRSRGRGGRGKALRARGRRGTGRPANFGKIDVPDDAEENPENEEELARQNAKYSRRQLVSNASRYEQPAEGEPGKVFSRLDQA